MMEMLSAVGAQNDLTQFAGGRSFSEKVDHY